MKMSALVWGTGRISSALIEKEHLYEKYNILAFVDNNISSLKRIFKEREVISPSSIAIKYQTDDCFLFDRLIIAVGDYKPILEQIRKEFPALIHKTITYHDIFKVELYEKYKNSADKEIQEILEWIRHNDLFFLPYDFALDYFEHDVEVLFDDESGMWYTVFKGHKMYFAKHIDTMEKASIYYKGLLAEQDERSPHRYLSDDIDVADGDIVVDCGAAEGNFSLDVVDRAKKIYIIECDDEWIEALKLTFKGYEGKVEIIKGKLTSYSMGDYINLDTIITEPVNFIKMDIEGAEWDTLVGARNLIEKSLDIKCAVCTYHRPYDEILIKDELSRYDMEVFHTLGYVWFSGIDYLPEWRSDCLCRCIVNGIKRGKSDA